MENKDSSRPKRGPMGGGLGRMGAPGEKAKDFKGTLKKLLKYLGKYKIAIIIVIIFAILSTVFSIVGPKILGEATTILFEGLMNMISENGLGIDFEGIKKILLTLLGLYIISAVFSYAQGWIMTKVTMKVTYKLRKDISHKINKLPLSYFDKKTQGEVLSYITNDVDTVSQTLNQGITQIITSVTMLLGILIMMLTISWQMTVVAVLVLPVAIGLVAGVVKKSQKYYIKQQEYLGNVNGHIEEMYTNHTIVRAFNGQKSEIEKQAQTTVASQKTAIQKQAQSAVDSQKTDIQKQAQSAVDAQKSDIQKQAQSKVDAQKEDIEKQAQAAVAAQKEQIKSVAAETVKQQEAAIKKQAEGAVEQEFTSGKTDYITNEAKKQLENLKPVIESGVKAQFVQKMAENNSAITNYDLAKAFYDQYVEKKEGAADEFVNKQIDTIINQLAGSVASTAKDASKIAAGEAAYTAASQTAGEAAYTGASLAAGTAAYTAASQTAGEAAYAGASLAAGSAAYLGASQAATTAAYTGAVSGAEQATITSAEQTKATVAASINQKQANGYSLVTGMKALADGTQTLYSSVPTLTSGIKQLVDGSNTLVANNAQLNSGASQLADGTNQIVSGVDQLTTGSKTLSEGAHTLADGMVQFNEEGINKILDAYNGDLKPFTDKLQAVIDAGEEYQTYSAIADGQTGSVKFIYKLASIDAKADSDK